MNEKDMNKNGVRLNKFIAQSGVCSRREADALIKKGLIQVNGKVVTEMGVLVQNQDTVMYNGKKLRNEKLVYLLLNKPKNTITTTKDPKGRFSVSDLIQNACEERIYPVGRLDRNTTGLLLFTNDGDLAKKLSHPSHQVPKVYQVTLDKPISKKDIVKIQEGVPLEEGVAYIDQIYLGEPGILGLEIHIGWNRVVRRIFEKLGYQVVKLDRTSYAGLTKKNLGRGKYRFLTEKEIIQLKYLK